MTEITRQDLWRAAAFYSRKRLRETGWPPETQQMASVLTAIVRRDLSQDKLLAGLRAESSDPAWQALAPQLEAALQRGAPPPTLEDMVNDMRGQAADAMEQAARNITSKPSLHAIARFSGAAMVGSPLGPFLAAASIAPLLK